MRALECLAALAISLVLAGCKGSETLDREDPSQNPAAPVAATPPATGASATAAPATVATPRLPGQPAVPGATAPVPASPDAGLPSDAGVGQDAGRADAAAGASGSTADKLKACADKCQPVLQGCLTPTFSADAGLQVKDPKACEAAFNACQAACKP
jgi:hypothetical protein